MPIYTRTGDKGMTSLLNGKRVLKSDIRVEAYGSIDELNSSIGVALSFLSKTKFKSLITEFHNIQHELFDIGSSLSNPNPPPIPALGVRTLEFEKLIDKLTQKLPPLKNFILPGGSKAGAQFHICRTLTRRAERRLVALAQKAEVENDYIIYLNRLSDLFFTIARYVNRIDKTPETKWIRKTGSNNS